MGELTCFQLASYNFFLLHNNQRILHNLESNTVFVIFSNRSWDCCLMRAAGAATSVTGQRREDLEFKVGTGSPVKSRSDHPAPSPPVTRQLIISSKTSACQAPPPHFCTQPKVSKEFPSLFFLSAQTLTSHSGGSGLSDQVGGF